MAKLSILGTTKNPTVHGSEKPDLVGTGLKRWGGGDGLGDLQRSLPH